MGNGVAPHDKTGATSLPSASTICTSTAHFGLKGSRISPPWYFLSGKPTRGQISASVVLQIIQGRHYQFAVERGAVSALLDSKHQAYPR